MRSNVRLQAPSAANVHDTLAQGMYATPHVVYQQELVRRTYRHYKNMDEVKTSVDDQNVDAYTAYKRQLGHNRAKSATRAVRKRADARMNEKIIRAVDGIYSARNKINPPANVIHGLPTT